MFRRSKPDTPAATTTARRSSGSTAYRPDAPADQPVQLGKGRPTPSRKEAEAAARARAKAALDPKLSRKQAREKRFEASRAAREGIKNGDERYLRPRDQGPLRRFVRDFIDARLSMAEIAVPGFLVSFLLSASGAAVAGSGLLNALLLVIVVDSVLLRFRLRRELKRRFPEQDPKGTTFYALARALQIRWLRLPKPQVKLGQALPETYR
ncbi:MAG: CblZ, a non-orthologous displasment for Alpha-ribazole-5'-phosphate phosphatase [uncultured Nocardioidaceae bacterium]|uniref:CblZ, a non-orthologous displasment for Alpha-ribazole-5'-phosphate phosphatase n=1 Tax=uncultured Nocardioidaceae bacterium TaxID=253824 RepID=A0A6J4M2B6_9ACTN|nr:MAG: CblZ, a non-orthologous displasment for Alpha-ribazole-5'-phosphate phosphatase [uncultured Nocardioidaceae bacterium]